MSSSANQHIIVVSRNGDEFQMTVNAAMQSKQLKRMVDDDCVSGKIPLNLDTAMLVKVMEYCKKHADHEAAKAEDQVFGEAELERWDAEFVPVDWTSLFRLILAANYLEIEGLLDLTCQSAADRIKFKSVEEVREIFNEKNDYTPEEEEELRRANQWAFENEGNPSGL